MAGVVKARHWRSNGESSGNIIAGGMGVLAASLSQLA